MADALKESDLRDARDEMVSRVVAEQRARGMLPSVSAAESFVAPITEKISRDADTLERKNIRPKPAKSVREDLGATSDALGEVNLATGEVSDQMRAHLAQHEAGRQSHPNLRGALRGMRSDPAWKLRMDHLLALRLPRIEFEKRCVDLIREYMSRFARAR